MKNFKYIRSTQKDIYDYPIYSGQIVSYGRFSGSSAEVKFTPDYGFRISGDNFADRPGLRIEKDITFWQKLLGTIKFAIFNLTGK